MLVVVVAMGCVLVPVMQVVHMTIVLDCFVAAPGAVFMAVLMIDGGVVGPGVVRINW